MTPKECFKTIMDFVESVPEEHFNMDCVLSVPSICGAIVEDSEVKYELKYGCGTSACVFGYLPVIFPEVFIYRHENRFSSWDNYIGVKNAKNKNYSAKAHIEYMLDLEDVLEFECLFGVRSLSDMDGYEFSEDDGINYEEACSRNKAQQLEVMKRFFEYKYA